jgi:hypothetical protein
LNENPLMVKKLLLTLYILLISSINIYAQQVCHSDHIHTVNSLGSFIAEWSGVDPDIVLPNVKNFPQDMIGFNFFEIVDLRRKILKSQSIALL